MKPQARGSVTPQLASARRDRENRRMLRAGTAVLAVALACGAAGCANVEAMRLYRSGTTALDRGESERAVAELEHAAALAPDVSAIQNHLGIAYEEAGRPDDARRAYERAVALDCSNRAAEANLNDLRSAADAAELDDHRSAPDGAEPNTSQGAAR
jgi:Flp pilus assembly protein TadD